MLMITITAVMIVMMIKMTMIMMTMMRVIMTVITIVACIKNIYVMNIEASINDNTYYGYMITITLTKRQKVQRICIPTCQHYQHILLLSHHTILSSYHTIIISCCLLYTSDAADE